MIHLSGGASTIVLTNGWPEQCGRQAECNLNSATFSVLSKVSVNSDCLQIESSFCQLTYLIIFSLNDKKNRILHVIMPWQHVNLLPVKSLYHVLLSPFHQLHLWSIWDNWNFLWTIFSQTLCFDFLLCQLAQLSLEFLSFANAKETKFGNVLVIRCFIYPLILFLLQNST